MPTRGSVLPFRRSLLNAARVAILMCRDGMDNPLELEAEIADAIARETAISKVIEALERAEERLEINNVENSEALAAIRVALRAAKRED